MQFNKCNRCGCFFVSNSNVCAKCEIKDVSDINKLKKYLEDSDTNSSIENISFETGISTKNLQRFFSSDELVNYNFSDLGSNSKFEL